MSHRRLFRIGALCVAATFAASVSAGSIRPLDDDEEDLVPTGKGWGERGPKETKPGNGKGNAGGRAKTTGSGIGYHGGPIILGTTNVYYIWYGNWTGNTATTILADFATGVGGSPYYNINTTYYNSGGTKVSNSVALRGQAAPAGYTYGASLSDSNIKSIVSDAIGSGALPSDANGVYFVLTSKDVTASSGFCTQYCGWHSYGSIGGATIKYSFVGNPDRCPSACAEQTTSSPNGNVGADAMASIIAHELEEAVTDPQLNAWYDRQGYENADKCAWTFGTMYKMANGSYANMKLGSRDYLIQRNWVNSGAGSCTLAYP